MQVSNSGLFGAPITFRTSGAVIMVNPMFVNRAAGDFHLQPGSPLIDRGIKLSQVTNDYDAVPRPYG